LEEFFPPYFFDTANAPRITSVTNVASGVTVTDPTAVIPASYGDRLTVTWSTKIPGQVVKVPITSAALIAPGSPTHGYDSNQRMVRLPMSPGAPGTSGTVQLQLPPLQALPAPNGPNVAPPQFYMLFLNNRKTYSRAWWIQLQTPAAG
jgi:hypothetical protein